MSKKRAGSYLAAELSNTVPKFILSALAADMDKKNQSQDQKGECA